MWARVARYAVPTERLGEAVEAFREAATEIQQLEGLKDGYVLADPESGMIFTITVWDDHRALDASESRATTARQRAARAADGSVEGVYRLEVVAEL